MNIAVNNSEPEDTFAAFRREIPEHKDIIKGELAEQTMKEEDKDKATKERKDKASVRGSYAQIASAVLALGALIVSSSLLVVAIIGFQTAAEQLQTASKQLQEVRAASTKRLFGDYLRLAVEKSDLLEPDYASVKKDASYKAFVWNLLYACDEIATTLVGEKGWQVGCEHHLTRHVQYLCEWELENLSFSDQLRAMIQKVAEEAASRKVPECDSRVATQPAAAR